MTLLLFFIVLRASIFCTAFEQTVTNSDVAFCSLQEKIENVNDYSLLVKDDQSPYHLYVIDNGEQDGDGQKLYTVVLNGTTYFKRYLIQPRVITKEGLILENIQAGNFLTETAEWKNQSFKLLQCPESADNAVIPADDFKKFSVNLKWTKKLAEFLIQFVISVQHEVKSEWIHVASKSSLIFTIEKVTSVTPPTTKKSELSFSIFNDKIKNADDQRAKLTNDDVALTAITVNETIEDYCKFAPCSDHGLCVSFTHDYTYECYCTDKWVGDICTTPNYCLTKPCKNQGVCVYDDLGFSCQCRNGWSGTLCETVCPLNLCKNGGTCVLNNSLKYSCICEPGWTGDTCDTAIHSCDSFPCFNGGTCKEKGNEYECICPVGYMGDRCQRPCQDMLQGCKVYSISDCNSENSTESDFYKINCAMSCSLCQFDKSTIITRTPLPPALEPLENLLGTWYTEVKTPKMRFPLDFISNTNGYYEKLEISHPIVSPFDGASLTFRSTAINRDNVTDELINFGFIFLHTKDNANHIALTTVGNDGMLLIEEGKMREKREFLLTTKYFHVHPSLIMKLAPKVIEIIARKMKRKFVWSDIRLEVFIEKFSITGKREDSSLVYRKLKYDD